MQEKEQKKSPIKQNILHFIEFHNVSKYDFYKKTGITRGVLDQNTGISEDNIAKFLAYYPQVNPDWLLSGNGNMLRTDINNVCESKVPYIAKKDKDGIPLIPASAMAGVFTGDIQVLEHECDRYIVPVFRGADFLISVKGSSMYPKYNSGDIVACKKLPLDTFFQWNKVYVLDTDQGPLIKRIQHGSTDDTLLIVSDNDKYKPFELNRHNIYNIAIVLGVIRLE